MSLSACAGAIQKAFEYFAGRAALGFIIPEWLPTPDNQQYSEAVRQLGLCGVLHHRLSQGTARCQQLSGITTGGRRVLHLPGKEGVQTPLTLLCMSSTGEGSVLQDANALGFTESPLQM